MDTFHNTAPPGPDDPEWDEWVADQLADVDVDTELGKEMAADAFRIAEGDLTEEEFHERHTEAVQAEFGVDDRPTKPAPDDTDADNPSSSTLSGSGAEGDQTRRRVLQAIGGVAAAGAGGLAGCLTEASETDNEADDDGIIDDIDTQKQWGMVIDTDRCIACLQCSEACKKENKTSRGAHWTYVFRWSDDENADYDDEHSASMTRPCQHCSRPSCTFVCPTQARFKRDEDGLVLTDYETCIGCRYCQVACPYGVNYFQWGEPDPPEMAEDGILDMIGGEETFENDHFEGDRRSKDGNLVGGHPPEGVMGKCTFCVHRQDSDDPELEGTTACEQACPVDAIHFGDMNNPNDDPQQHLEERPDLNRTKLLEQTGNQPNITYVGPQPGRNSQPVQGPESYENMGMVEHRREVIDRRFREADSNE